MYQRNGVWWTRVRTPFGSSRRVSLETRHEPTARSVDAWANDVRERLDRHRVLEAVVDGELTLPQAFVLGELEAAQYLAARRETAKDREVTEEDVAAWERWVTANGTRTVGPIYRRQVELLLPRPLYQSMLTPKAISEALERLDASGATKNRYKAAVGSLCAYLHRVGRLDANPMPQVARFGHSRPRELWHSTEESLRVLERLPAVQQGMEAVMWACGWELAAVRNALVEDFDLVAGTAFARGTKTPSRRRMTVITEASALPYLEQALKGKLPKARVWPEADRAEAILRVHKQACRAARVEVSTLHDWRHTFAVREIRKGRSLQFVAQMLGHRDTTPVQRIYGRYVLTPEELQRHAAQSGHIGVA